MTREAGTIGRRWRTWIWPSVPASRAGNSSTSATSKHDSLSLSLVHSLPRFNRHLLGQVKSELPSTFSAYRFQQHRWSCGPANLFRKMTREIIINKVRKSTPSTVIGSVDPVDLSDADGAHLDEGVPSLPLLPPRKDSGPPVELRLLLHRGPSRDLRSRDSHSIVGSVLRSDGHHHP